MFSFTCTLHIIHYSVVSSLCLSVPHQMLELLVEKCALSSHPAYTQPGDLFRRIMECVASGIFLPGEGEC